MTIQEAKDICEIISFLVTPLAVFVGILKSHFNGRAIEKTKIKVETVEAATNAVKTTVENGIGELKEAVVTNGKHG